jgi:undecaprenyl-diphosphatase
MPTGIVDLIGGLDASAFRWLRTYHAPAIDVLMAGLSDISRGGTIWCILSFIVAALHPKRWPAAVQVLLVVAVAQLSTDFVAKPLFDRARPFETTAETRVYGVRPTTRSFPSGHVANAAAGAYGLARLAPEGRVIFWGLAMLVSVSRVYLGVHYPADVLGGWLFGLAVAWFVIGRTAWRFQSNAANARTLTPAL